jgi:septal ring factor EnvC (AmiA/AmiB activator)
MAKALKPLIIVMLVLSIAALVLGSMLFGKREVLKGRTQKTDQALVDIARNLHFDDFSAEQIAAKDTAGLDAMQTPLNKLTTAAAIQYDDLQNTKQDLATTKEDLAATRDQLAAVQSRLEQTEAQVAQLNERIIAKDAEIAQGEATISALESEKTGLQSQIDDLNGQLAKKDEEALELQDAIVTLKNDVKDLEAQLGISNLGEVPKGLSGRIVVVNKDWNFVVLNIGSEKGLVPKAEMLVHRGDKLVGKVQVSGVSRNLAIAEILRDWQQASLEEGDNVVF